MTTATVFAVTLAQSTSTFELLQTLGKTSLGVALPGNIDKQLDRALMIEQAKRIVAPHGPGVTATLSNAQLSSLAKFAQEAAALHGSSFVAETLLRACDEGFGAAVWREFEALTEPLELSDGSVFPIAAQPLTSIFGSRKFTPHPSSQQNVHARGRFLGVIPRGTSHRVVFDFTRPLLLSKLVDTTRFVLAFPNQDPSDLELTLDVQRGRFFDVRPKNVRSQERQVLKLLRRAEASRAALVVLPELSVTPAISSRIRHFVRESCQHVQLVVAGSHHAKLTNGTRVNRLEVHSTFDGEPAVHDKFNPFELKQWHAASFTPPLIEDIDCIPVIRVQWASGWSFVTLICKDFLDVDAATIVRLVRPNFVVIVAFSEEMSVFTTGAQDLAARSQCTVAVCNFPGGAQQRTAALVALPTTSTGNAPDLHTEQAADVLGKALLVTLRGSKTSSKILDLRTGQRG